MPAAIAKPSNVVKRGTTLVCMNCRHKMRLPLPCPAEVVKPIVLAFWVYHTNCNFGVGHTAARFAQLIERVSG